MQTEATKKFTENVDVASHENAAQLTSTVFGWWRKDVPLEVSYRYWRDVHSVTVARAPGIYQYRLLHLGSNRSDLWSQLKGINYTLPDEDQSHGIAQILFLSQADLQTFGKSELITKLGSHNWRKAQTKVQKLHEHIHNTRKDFHFKLAHHLCDAFGDKKIIQPLNQTNNSLGVRCSLLKNMDSLQKRSPYTDEEYSNTRLSIFFREEKCWRNRPIDKGAYYFLSRSPVTKEE